MATARAGRHATRRCSSAPQRVIPGGVNSPVRAFRAVGGTPYFVARAEGPYVWDVEGTRYIDLVQTYGAIIPATPTRRSSRRSAGRRATARRYGAPTAREMLLAEAIVARVPSCRAGAPGEQRHRGDDDRHPPGARRHRPAEIVKFAGNYHGHGDALLAAGGSGVATLGLSRHRPASPTQAVAETIVVPYNVVPDARRRRGVRDRRAGRRQHGPRRARARLPRRAAGRVRPRRRAADLRRGDHRVPPRRAAAPRQRFGVRPDLTCFGKVIGGGLPIGAFGGRADVMDGAGAARARCTRRARCRGTRWRPPPGWPRWACSTSRRTSASRRPPTRLADGLRHALNGAEIPSTVPQFTTLLGLHFDAVPAVDQDTAKLADKTLFAAFFHAMLRRGVALSPGSEEILFPGLAHDDHAIEK